MKITTLKRAKPRLVYLALTCSLAFAAHASGTGKAKQQ